MKSLILPFLLLFTACQNSRVLTLQYEFSRSTISEAIILNSDASDFQIEKGLEELLGQFGIDLQYDYRGEKLFVTGSEQNLKAFEFVALNLIKFQPIFRLNGSIDSSVTGQKVSFETYLKPFDSERISFESFDEKEPELEANLNIDYRRFDHKARVTFKVVEVQGEERCNTLDYSGIFQNFEKKEAYIKLRDKKGKLNCSLVTNLQVDWELKNSHFFKNINQVHKLENGKTLTAVYTNSGLEESVGDLNKYLQAMGMNFDETDKVIFSKSMNTIFLFSSAKNSQYLIDIFRPLCCFSEYEAELVGEVENKEGLQGEFKIPVTVNSGSQIEVSNTNEFSLFFDYKMTVDVTPIKIGGWYNYSDETDIENEIYVAESFENDFRVGEVKKFNLHKGHSLKLQVINQNISD